MNDKTKRFLDQHIDRVDGPHEALVLVGLSGNTGRPDPFLLVSQPTNRSVAMLRCYRAREINCGHFLEFIFGPSGSDVKVYQLPFSRNIEWFMENMKDILVPEKVFYRTCSNLWMGEHSMRIAINSPDGVLPGNAARPCRDPDTERLLRANNPTSAIAEVIHEMVNHSPDEMVSYFRDFRPKQPKS